MCVALQICILGAILFNKIVSKICGHAISVCDPFLFLWKKICDPRFFIHASISKKMIVPSCAFLPLLFVKYICHWQSMVYITLFCKSCTFSSGNPQCSWNNLSYYHYNMIYHFSQLRINLAKNSFMHVCVHAHDILHILSAEIMLVFPCSALQHT